MSWKIALAIGEPVPRSLPARLSSINQNIKLYNLYGPSETSLAATVMHVPLPGEVDIPAWQDTIPAGSPLPNYAVYVLDSKMRPMAAGVQGEIYIGGVGVGAGYLHNPTLTAERFVTDIFNKGSDKSTATALLHRSGDIGRWDQTGALLIEGRVAGDTQIKLRGLRIDLVEVENAIIHVANGTVSEVTVSVHPSRSQDDEFLVAHVVFDKSHKTDNINQDIAAISSNIRRLLPQYMCPTIITPMKSLPRMNSGKIDRKAVAALPLPENVSHQDTVTVSSITDTESRLSLLWNRVIGQEPLTKQDILFLPNTDFFHVGGTSLRLLSLQSNIRNVFGVEISILDMFEHSTLADMARCVERVNYDAHDAEPDWEMEASLLPEFFNVTPLVSPISDSNTSEADKVAILTGATGAVGKMLLEALIRDPQIKRIHCLALRDIGRHRSLSNDEKVLLHAGDLGLPRLGLAKENADLIFSECNIIIHNGAEVSYLKTYRSLQKVNVESTKELVKMCMPRMIPLHYVSTTSVERKGTGYYDVSAVRNINKKDEQGPAGCDTLEDGRKSKLGRLGRGYTISKHISEQFLGRLKAEYPSWPIWIHRPSLISNEARVSGGPNSVIESIRRYSKLLHAIPALPNGSMGIPAFGMFNVVSMEVVIRGILDAVTGPQSVHTSQSVQILRHVGDDELDISDLRGWANEQVGSSSNGEMRNGTMGEMNLVEWASRAGSLGMDPTIVIFMKTIAAELELAGIS